MQYSSVSLSFNSGVQGSIVGAAGDDVHLRLEHAYTADHIGPYVTVAQAPWFLCVYILFSWMKDGHIIILLVYKCVCACECKHCQCSFII